ncbi:MAG: SsrA-binding protein SmpB, partial [Thermoanaerobaculia bacterium]
MKGARPAAGAAAIKPIASNRKAFHDYFIEDRAEAGLVLTGTEVKSLREGRAQLKDSFVQFRAGEAYLIGAHISPYGPGSWTNHTPERERKLLLHRRELDRWSGAVATRGV